MPGLDDEIARHLAAAAAAGELKAAPSYGKPMAQTEGWDDTPEELRQAFKILKDAGFTPPEVALFHERARLRSEIELAPEDHRLVLQRQLAELEQKIALRLEAMQIRSRV